VILASQNFSFFLEGGEGSEIDEFGSIEALGLYFFKLTFKVT
jgi:hypothetical protein